MDVRCETVELTKEGGSKPVVEEEVDDDVYDEITKHSKTSG